MHLDQIYLEDDSIVMDKDKRMNIAQMINQELNQRCDQNQKVIPNKLISISSLVGVSTSEADQLNYNHLILQESRRKISNDVLNTTNINTSTKRRVNNDDSDNTLFYILDGKQRQNKSELFTKLNEININNDGADRRRQLLNHLDSDLDNIRTKRQSLLDISNTFEDAKKPPPEATNESMQQLQKTDSNQKINKRETIKDKIQNTMILSNHRFNSKSDLNIKKSVSRTSVEENLLQIKFPSIEMLKQASKEGSNHSIQLINGKRSKMIKQENEEKNIPSSRTIQKENKIITRPVTLVYIRRFINHLKKSIYSSLYKNINTHQIKLINDFSHYEEGQIIDTIPLGKKKTTVQSNNKVKDRFSKVQGAVLIYENYLKNIIISSQSNFFMAFQVILLFSIFIQIYLIPLRVGFDLHSDELNFVSIITLPVFFIEILLNCITSYYFEGLEVKKQKKIIKRYIKNSFLGDVTTLFVLILSLNSNNIWISLVFLIRLKQIPKLINSIDDHYQLEHRFPSSFELLKLLLLIATIGHYCGCGFNYLGQYEISKNEYSWLIFKKIESKNWNIQYLHGLYFSFITMITVGYGDITPQTNKEIIYVLFMTFLSCGIFGYSINTIGSIFREMQIRKSELKQFVIQKQNFIVEQSQKCLCDSVVSKKTTIFKQILEISLYILKQKAERTQREFYDLIGIKLKIQK